VKEEKRWKCTLMPKMIKWPSSGLWKGRRGGDVKTK
jgi:hypothetical protein